MVKPYLPDIMKGAIERVDLKFFNRPTDPFHVFFDKGIIGQVRRSVYANNHFPLVWLVFKWKEIFGGKNIAVNSTVDFQLVIAMPTEATYTQQQREDNNYAPRLIPIYDEILEQIHAEPKFITEGATKIEHERHILPYWGMGDIQGPDQPNLFEGKFIDAISVYFTGLRIKRANNC